MSETNPPAENVQYEELYAEVPQWPKVIGITSLVWGGLGLCCTGWGLINSLRGVKSGTGPGEFPPDLAQAMEAHQHSPMVMVGFAVAAVSIVLLLTAGVTTLTRRIAGRYLHLGYAVLSLGQYALTVYQMSQVSRIMTDWAAQNPGHDFAKAMGVITAVMKIMTVLMGLLFAGYPLFLLVWFGLVKRTKESMTGVPEGPPAA